MSDSTFLLALFSCTDLARSLPLSPSLLDNEAVPKLSMPVLSTEISPVKALSLSLLHQGHVWIHHHPCISMAVAFSKIIRNPGPLLRPVPPCCHLLNGSTSRAFPYIVEGGHLIESALAPLNDLATSPSSIPINVRFQHSPIH